MTRLEQIHVYFYPVTCIETAFISDSTSGLLRYKKGQEEALKMSKKKQTKENKFTQVDEKSNSNTSS